MTEAETETETETEAEAVTEPERSGFGRERPEVVAR
jgi:hypothetical protein